MTDVPDEAPLEPPLDPGAEEDEALTEAERARRRRLAAALGDPLPDGTRDDSAEGWGERENPGRDDEWFRRQVPPHHG